MQCRCGKIAEIKKETKTGGHGYIDTLWHIECSCGLRTISAVEHWQGTKEECLEKIKNIWESNQ